MKSIPVYRTIILIAILGIFPAMLYAADKEIEDKPLLKIGIDEISTVFIDSIPIKRGGTTDDVANFTLFLASDLSDYITGQCINVCGGMLT